ncbi:MAG: hypothetical protein RLZZ153_508 [Pseudomonadota bacterium]|jgi:light-harvesting complex 1 beta chain
MTPMTSASLRDDAKGVSFAYRIVFAVSFVTFFVLALIAQLLLLPWRSWLPGAEGSRTLIGGVRAAVYTLMSHLI